MKNKFLCFLFFVFSTSSVYASNDGIIFLNINFPPLWIPEGPEKGNGIADKAEIFFRNNLKDFKYQNLTVNVARAEYFMSTPSDKTYCAVPHGKGFFKNVVESKVWTAISSHVVTAQHEFLKKIRIQPFYEYGQVDLNQFFTYSKAKEGVITKNQHYPVVEEVIAKRPGINIRQITSPDMMKTYNMIKKKTADYTFLYESTAKYMQLTGNKIDYVTIRDLNEYFVDIVVGCNNTPTAKKFVNAINEHIKSLRRVGLKQLQRFHSLETYRRLKPHIDSY